MPKRLKSLATKNPKGRKWKAKDTYVHVCNDK